MALFDVWTRRGATQACPDTTPAGFLAMAEKMAERRDTPESLHDMGRDAGRSAAENGATLETVLDDLAATCRTAGGMAEPPFALVRAVAEGWSDAQTGYLHSLSCEDPLTRLATLHHVRTRLGDAYRAAAREGGGPQVALVVVDVIDREAAMSRLDRTMRMVHVSEMLRTVYSGDETIGQVSGGRAVALVPRDDQLARSVKGLRDLLAGWALRGGPTTRVWIEGLPGSLGAAVKVLDELAR
jgi:hypothetical protein